jgi:plastocyanin
VAYERHVAGTDCGTEIPESCAMNHSTHHRLFRFPIPCFLFPAVAAMFVSGAASAMNHVVLVGGASNGITPANTDVLVGDTVTFTNAGGEHNVASIAGAPFEFRCAEDCGANGSVSNSPWQSTITIPPQAAHGSIGFYCERHGLSMSGTLSVTNPVDLQSFDID